MSFSFFFFSSRRRHTRSKRDWSSDVCSSDLETTFFYGENLAAHLRTKLRLTTQYRHHPPRIDRDIYWRPMPGTQWPEGWAESRSEERRVGKECRYRKWRYS